MTGVDAGRVCERCNRPLSRYNAGDFCQACVSAGRSDECGERSRGVSSGPGDVGVRLRALRRQRGMSLEVLAGLSGLTKGFLSRVENGRLALNRYSDIVALAAALQVSPGAD
jgi:ribosome-binding protein aMBF1 (putative translation factor)